MSQLKPWEDKWYSWIPIQINIYRIPTTGKTPFQGLEGGGNTILDLFFNASVLSSPGKFPVCGSLMLATFFSIFHLRSWKTLSFRPNLARGLLLQIKSYLDTVKHILSWIIYGYFCSPKLELSTVIETCGLKAYLPSSPSQKKFTDPFPDHHLHNLWGPFISSFFLLKLLEAWLCPMNHCPLSHVLNGFEGKASRFNTATDSRSY